jgi:hypothetical protein
MLTEAYGADGMNKSVSLIGIKGLKRVGKTWKTTKELDVWKLTGQMKIVHFEFLEQCRTVNQHCYLEILVRLCEAVCRRRRKLWPDTWILHHVNAQCPCSWRARCPGVFGQELDNEIGPFTIFARFGPMRHLAIPKTEDRCEGPQIFRHCRHSRHVTTILKSIPEEEFQKSFEQCKHRLTKCIRRWQQPFVCK